MFKRVICIIVLMFATSVFGQNYTKHKVAKGETITQIAQKYKVTPYDIYKLNPDSQSGIQPDAILLIPKSIEKVTSNEVPFKEKTYTVKAKETLYSIAKENNVEISDLEEANPFLKTDGLQPGQVLKIMKYEEPPKVQMGTKILSTHEVVAGDTKYSISKKYGISVEELEKQNPEIKDNLPVGFKLKINSSEKAVVPTEVVKPKTEVYRGNTLEYTVKSGETMYSLTKLLGLSEASLIGLNPSLKEGVKEGMILKVPATLSFSKETKNSLKDLTKSISSQKRKELVLFLPFNASKIQNDTVTSISERLKKDKFLNMTLDFYAGALMAIDSAKVLGMNLDIKIYDSQETKNSTSALSVISNNDFSSTDAVIGPFYQVNVEKVADALENKNIPVISPLSRDEGKSYKNLFQSMPHADAVKGAMFNYMQSKNGNIIAVIDPKKTSIKEYIQDFQKDVKVVGLSDKGGFVADSIKKHFVKDRMNYVVMASEKTGTIFTTTSAMSSVMKDYQVQLVILEPNETLDFEEIALSRLTKLKMAYPSATKDNDSDEAQKFERAFKKKNKILPNQYAVRGFDLTFDTMLRLAQDKPFEESINDDATEQVESKFDYAKKISGGYTNNGIYILYYDEDLTIKQAQ
ncbi:LysM peptidoglycan-binding domain-containing protein [Flavobacterium sp.]|uniref:amino acid ABC transporter substrate-binding protein n=1 Tax=Flavobacterium sp. TaxID=239 RepID=UPI002603750B|nr:LysM peptidoglycan-binding domain-containing protein [Flavobacterium sp.]